MDTVIIKTIHMHIFTDQFFNLLSSHRKHTG